MYNIDDEEDNNDNSKYKYLPIRPMVKGSSTGIQIISDTSVLFLNDHHIATDKLWFSSSFSSPGIAISLQNVHQDDFFFSKIFKPSRRYNLNENYTSLFIFVIIVFQGPKTVHFWAPMFKWGLVIAGLADINRPVEKVSLFQSSGTHKQIRAFTYHFYNNNLSLCFL